MRLKNITADHIRAALVWALGCALIIVGSLALNNYPVIVAICIPSGIACLFWLLKILTRIR